MTAPHFRAAVRPVLPPEAAELVRIYDSTYGSSSPGCCPEALAAVLQHLASTDPSRDDLIHLAFALRGSTPLNTIVIP